MHDYTSFLNWEPEKKQLFAYDFDNKRNSFVNIDHMQDDLLSLFDENFYDKYDIYTNVKNNELILG